MLSCSSEIASLLQDIPLAECKWRNSCIEQQCAYLRGVRNIVTSVLQQFVSDCECPFVAVVQLVSDQEARV